MFDPCGCLIVAALVVLIAVVDAIVARREGKL